MNAFAGWTGYVPLLHTKAHKAQHLTSKKLKESLDEKNDEMVE